MEALRDPFSRVYPMFWPVLWLSLRAFAAWSRQMIEEGHGYGGLSIEITWYGWIHVTAIDLSVAGKDFRRHMTGEAREDGWGVLRRAGKRVDRLLNPSNALHAREGVAGGPRSGLIDSVDRSEPEKAPAGARPRTTAPQPGTSPPLADAPLPHSGRGAGPASQAAPIPAPRGRWRWHDGCSPGSKLHKRLNAFPRISQIVLPETAQTDSPLRRGIGIIAVKAGGSEVAPWPILNWRRPTP